MAEQTVFPQTLNPIINLTLIQPVLFGSMRTNNDGIDNENFRKNCCTTAVVEFQRTNGTSDQVSAATDKQCSFVKNV